MTDTGPPTNPGDIWVTGQRLQPDGSFPPGPGGRGPIDPGTPVVPFDPLEPPPPSDTPIWHPCDDPDRAREWNADAAAAEALRRMQADANDPLLDARERSFVIARNPATGQIFLGNMLVGVPRAGEASFDMAGIDPAHIIGLMHSHPGSGPYPSGPDRQSLYPYWRNQILEAGGNPNQLRLYMVGTHNDASGARLQIQVYDHRNMDPEPGPENPGPEVNPDAQPCP